MSKTLADMTADEREQCRVCAGHVVKFNMKAARYGCGNILAGPNPPNTIEECDGLCLRIPVPKMSNGDRSMSLKNITK